VHRDPRGAASAAHHDAGIGAAAEWLADAAAEIQARAKTETAVADRRAPDRDAADWRWAAAWPGERSDVRARIPPVAEFGMLPAGRAQRKRGPTAPDLRGARAAARGPRVDLQAAAASTADARLPADAAGGLQSVDGWAPPDAAIPLRQTGLPGEQEQLPRQGAARELRRSPLLHAKTGPSAPLGPDRCRRHPRGRDLHVTHQARPMHAPSRVRLE